MLFKYTVLLLTVLILNIRCEDLLFYEDSIGTLDESIFEKVKDKSKIESLDLRGNGIVRILDTAFQGFDNVNTLALAQNYIECLPKDVFHDVQNVQYIEMHSNKIKYLHKNTFSKLRKLIRLTLGWNLLRKFDVGLFDENVSLEHLSFHDNLLTYIPEGIFSKLNNLRELDLSANYIHYIDRNSMPSAVPSKLRDVALYANKLQTIDFYDSTLNSLSKTDFGKNPLYCDCKLKRLFKKWNFNIQQNWRSTCEGPEHLKNRDWTRLQESDFACDGHVVHFNSETIQFPRIGESLVLACHINIPVGDMTITYKNGTNVVDHLRRRQRFPTIHADSSKEHSWYKVTIKEVQPNDAGSYACVINGKVEREFALTVDDPSYYEKCITNNFFPGK